MQIPGPTPAPESLAHSHSSLYLLHLVLCTTETMLAYSMLQDTLLLGHFLVLSEFPMDLTGIPKNPKNVSDSQQLTARLSRCVPNRT